MQAVRRKNLPGLLAILLIFMLVLSACGEPALSEESLHAEGDNHTEEADTAHSEEADVHAEGDAADTEAADADHAAAETSDAPAEGSEATSADAMAEGDPMDAEAMHSEQGGVMRVHADVPEEFASLENPYAGSEEAAAEGAAIFATACTVCHGEAGHGDGPGAAALDPKPANLSDGTMMAEVSDAYLFWRISKGGNMDPFNSAMPTWESAYTEAQRWQLVTYVRSLSQ